MERIKRTAVTAITATALLAGSMGVALAAADPAPAPAPVPAKPSKTTSAGQIAGNERPEPITARATAQGVRAWQQFRVYGAVEELRPGTRITLQQKQGKRWVTLPASVRTGHDGTYRMRVLLGLRGTNTLRIVGGGTASAPFTVTVR
ncbi:hypothetical protein ACFYT4_31245 [Streptomyces sp. NPDC004609]|uniref:hypothetical protein n=1 Tax=Streptomyces sp. NPDC004609 TaxID=3364704 RepID=UPI00369C61E8